MPEGEYCREPPRKRDRATLRGQPWAGPEPPHSLPSLAHKPTTLPYQCLRTTVQIAEVPPFPTQASSSGRVVVLLGPAPILGVGLWEGTATWDGYPEYKTSGCHRTVLGASNEAGADVSGESW